MFNTLHAAARASMLATVEERRTKRRPNSTMACIQERWELQSTVVLHSTEVWRQ